MQLFGDFPDVYVVPAKRERRRTADHAQRLELRERAKNFLRDAVGQELVLRIRADVREREHRHHRRPLRDLARDELLVSRPQQHRHEFRDGRISVLRRGRERALERLVLFGPDFRPRDAHARCAFGEAPPQAQFERGRAERRRAREHLEAHHRERVLVGPRVHVALARCLFGAHVGGRAEREAGLRHAVALGVADRARDPEVEDEGVPRPRDQHVFRLHVPMDDAAGMRVRKRVGDLRRDAQRVRDGHRTFAREPFAQRLALDRRHDVIQHSLSLARVEQRHDVRMREARRDHDLLQEAFGADALGDLLAQHLDCHATLVLHVLREVDFRRGAAPELTLHPIGGRERVDQGPGRPSHDAPARGFSSTISS